MVKTERKDVGVPLSVVLQPSDEVVVVVGVCAAVKASNEETSVEAWRKLERAMFASARCCCELLMQGLGTEE